MRWIFIAMLNVMNENIKLQKLYTKNKMINTILYMLNILINYLSCVQLFYLLKINKIITKNTLNMDNIEFLSIISDNISNPEVT